ncbi:uncharacterized protein LY89DRAFT_789492 [Mollisia scopiformis]|uniref:C2H2-type domain-containing protein n=1 Tax=Mollisia scopiformis TaxID=149040 RepID=A0A132B5Y8_MOLSC|nr:uncharacterized protein LY89DRAFT_789492 [Mollisia scopiformis]KUJ07826.1 hypothetical protein LY89DRAFT_789492 [Mollisia scopiformis]
MNYKGMECRFCQKSFSKGEHLRRHERSHTGARPFRCKECQRPFARQDSLARHEKLHTRKDPIHYPSPPSSLISQPSQRMTASLSPMGIPEMAHESPVSLPGGMSDQLSVAGDQNSAQTMPPPPPSAELDFDLMWPDSEDLFETLMASETNNQWQMPFTTLPISSKSLYTSNTAFSTPSSFREQGPSIDAIPSGESHRAVHNVSNMVTTLSSSVTAAVEATSLSSVFLDECLHMFFCRFIPTFPVLHRATFVFRECTQPLLLNAMAIGSLYLGPKDSIAKGEALWRLAHVAVTTSWEVLITHRGPYDSCQGVQLVVTALLAQIYGALSKNRVIRTTSQAFHALGFFWARQCTSSLPSPLPSPNASESEKNTAWRTWAAKEIQQRALLGHYLVDGLISRMSGETPSVRHTANALGLPSTEISFEARTADEWLTHMRSQETTQFSFRKIISSLFLPEGQALLHHTFSAFSLRVILEGLQSLVSDVDSDEALIGVPTKSELRRALAQLHESIAASPNLSNPERLELFLRWHTICLDACKDSSLLCRSVCKQYNIAQHVVATKQADDQQLDLVSWANTEDARRALVHAIAIQEIVEQLPRGRAHVIHIPSSLFASATVYCVFSLAGQTTVRLPAVVDWQSVLSTRYEDVGSGQLGEGGDVCETRKYVRGEYAAGVFGATGAGKNLLYELNSMQKLFRCLCSQWGIAYDMEDVIDQWISLCH